MKNILEKNKKAQKTDFSGTLSYRICPIERKKQEDAASGNGGQYPVWEYLHSINGEDEIWLEDDIFDFVCIS